MRKIILAGFILICVLVPVNTSASDTYEVFCGPTPPPGFSIFKIFCPKSRPIPIALQYFSGCPSNTPEGPRKTASSGRCCFKVNLARTTDITTDNYLCRGLPGGRPNRKVVVKWDLWLNTLQHSKECKVRVSGRARNGFEEGCYGRRAAGEFTDTKRGRRFPIAVRYDHCVSNACDVRGLISVSIAN